MGNALVRASLRRLEVRFNGDEKDKLAKQLAKLDKAQGSRKQKEEALPKKPSDKQIDEIEGLSRRIAKLQAAAQDNAVVCKLSYPRSGTSSVEAMRAVRLPSTRAGQQPPVDNPNPEFLKHGIFKETIQGEALLEVAVTDSDPRNAFLQFLRRVLSTAFSAVTKGVISDISGVVANSTATVLSKDISSSLQGSDKKRLQLVAKSERVTLRVDGQGRLHVSGLGQGKGSYANGILTLTLKAPRYLRVAPNSFIHRGADNGQVQLALDAEPA